MHLDRLRRHEEALCDVAVRPPPGREIGDSSLARRQGKDSSERRRAGAGARRVDLGTDVGRKRSPRRHPRAQAHAEAAREPRWVCVHVAARRRARREPSRARGVRAHSPAERTPPRDGRCRPCADRPEHTKRTSDGARGSPCARISSSSAASSTASSCRPSRSSACALSDRQGAIGGDASIPRGVRMRRRNRALVGPPFGQQHTHLRSSRRIAGSEPAWVSRRRPKAHALADCAPVDQQLGENRSRPLRLGRHSPERDRFLGRAQLRFGLRELATQVLRVPTPQLDAINSEDEALSMRFCPLDVPPVHRLVEVGEREGDRGDKHHQAVTSEQAAAFERLPSERAHAFGMHLRRGSSARRRQRRGP